ncbi:MAG: hypothetical protein WCB19_01145 [Thermoplasmata archaeon]
MSGRGWPASRADSPIMGSYGDSDSGVALTLLSGVLALLISGALAVLGVILVAYAVPDVPYGAEAVLVLSGLAFVVGLSLLLWTRTRR